MNLRRAALWALVPAGLVAGHSLAYLAALPAASHRHAVLVLTGHGYLSFAASVAAVLGAAAAALALGGGLSRLDDDRPSVGWAWGRLGLVQSGAFLVLESLERLVSGAPLDGVLTQVLVIGLVVQVLVALAGALLVVGLDRAGAALARRATVVPGPVGASAIPAEPLLASSADHLPRSSRGPPSFCAGT